MSRLRDAVPRTFTRKLRRLASPVGGVRFGNLRRIEPVSRHFGFDRGQPVDRLYVEHFLSRHAADVHGRVLEVGDDAYTRQFGGDRVTATDVLHINAQNPRATIVDDLAEGATIPSDAFDCLLLTQTLHMVFDVRSAVATIKRVLKPGGVALLTVPGISQIDAGEWNSTWYWSFTPAVMRRLFEEQFAPADLDVVSYGNVLAACAFLHGLAREELLFEELDAHDPLYPMVVGLRAVKRTATAS